MEKLTSCASCGKPALPGSSACAEHASSFGTAETLMGAPPPKFQTRPNTQEAPRVQYTPSLSASGEHEVFGPGAAIGEYVVEEKIGEGGMGEVWSAIQPTISKRVAIKLLNIKLRNNEVQLARFKREALVVNQIKHRHLVDIFGFGELPDKRPYFIMEFLEGETLSSFMRQRGALSYSQISMLLGQICRALQAAHDRGVVHRDLKPDNIFMLSGDDIFVKLLDFGIAKLEEDEEGLTKTGTRFGTPIYMSPEQCREAKHVDARSDIYSLGIILYELLCGRTPFYQKGDPSIRVMIRHQSEAPALPSSVATHRKIPKELDDFVLKTLAKDPDQRPQTCTQFYNELKTALPKDDDEPITGENLSEPKTIQNTQNGSTFVSAPSLPAPNRSHVGKLVAVALALLGIVGVAIFFTQSKNQSQAKESSALPAAAPTSIAIAAPPVASQPAASEPATPESTSAPAAPASLPEESPKGKKDKNKKDKTKTEKTKGEATKTESTKTEPTKTEEPKGTTPTKTEPKINKDPDFTLDPFKKKKQESTENK